MNKKLKKALYMFGFALPIVGIPIITVACGTQTSQNTPKEADKNQNEQTPKQDENKKVVISSSLSSSKIYDENLLNSNVVELIKLFEEKSNLEKIKKITEDISKKLKKGLNSYNDLSTLDEVLKNLESFVSLISETKIKSINAIIDKAKASVEKAKIETANKVLLEGKESKTKTEAENLANDAIKLIDESFNEINKNAINLYKKLFLNESSESIEFSKLKYSDFFSKLPELKLSNFFNIENLKKYLQNLSDDNKLNEIRLKDIFNTNINSIIEYLKNENEKIKLDFEKQNKNENKIFKSIKQYDSDIFNKINGKLIDLTKFENIESLLKEFTFSDLFNLDKLQEKLN